ncbi:29434_t:CDS:10, partial [Gigaspora margarita]
NTSDTRLGNSENIHKVDDPVDLCIKVPNLYHLLDLHKDKGSNESAVDKIIISQNSLEKFCNNMVPNSFKSISEIDYASLNSKSLDLTGVYGTRDNIANFLYQKNLIDNQIPPSLNTGIYLLIKNDHGLVIHWPEEDCYNVQSFKNKKNVVTLHRYFTKLTDVHFCLLSEGDLKTFDFNFRKKSSNEVEDSDDEDIVSELVVQEIEQDRTDFKILEGFELNLSELINTKLTLPPSFPFAMSIESCYHQSFLTCHLSESQEMTEPQELSHTASELQSLILTYLQKDYSLHISQSIGFDGLINLAHTLEVGKELLESFEKEKQKVTYDHEQRKLDVISADSKLITNMFKSKLQCIYGLFEETSVRTITDAEGDKIRNDNSDIIDKLESFINVINLPKWMKYKERFLSIENSFEESADQEKQQPLILTIHDDFFKNKNMFVEKVNACKEKMNKCKEKCKEKFDEWVVSKYYKNLPENSDQNEISDQQFVQSYLSNKDFNAYPDAKKQIIEFFRNEYVIWKDTLLPSIEERIKDSHLIKTTFKDLQSNLKTILHKIEQNYFEKIYSKIKEKYKTLEKQKFKLKFALVTKQPPLIDIVIYETHIAWLFKTPIKDFKSSEKDILIDIYEPQGLILLYKTKSTKLTVYKFKEKDFELELDSTFDVDIDTPDILKVIFVQCAQRICFVLKNGKAKFFNIKSGMFQAKALEFPANTVNVLSSQDGTCLVAFTNEGQLNSKAYFYLESRHKALRSTVPNFEEQAQKEIIGEGTNFQSVFEVGDCISIDNEKKLVTEINSNFRLKIKGCFSKNNQNNWHLFNILPRSKLNGLIDIYADIYETFPISPCINDEKNKAPQLFIFLDLEMSTQKPATLLREFKINVKHYQDLFDDSIIRQNASKSPLGDWIIQLCCLIPIQIAIARGNKLIPLYNGLDVPEDYYTEPDKGYDKDMIDKNKKDKDEKDKDNEEDKDKENKSEEDKDEEDKIKEDKDIKDKDKEDKHNGDKDKKNSYTEIISRTISFGWYEGIFKYLKKRKIKVVSSM